MWSCYMMSPHHWGLIDGWFDPEMPQKIVDLDLAHVYHATHRSVLAAALTPQTQGSAPRLPRMKLWVWGWEWSDGWGLCGS